MELIPTVEAGDLWVIHCAWAPWKASDAETGTLNIATQMCLNIQPSAMSTPVCGLSNGNVTLISVAQKLLIPLGSPSGLEITAAIRDGGVPKYVDSGESGCRTVDCRLWCGIFS